MGHTSFVQGRASFVLAHLHERSAPELHGAILFKTACKRGPRARMSTEYKSHVQDAEGVTTTCLDRLTGQELTIRSKYLIGADGGNSLVAENEALPFEGKMGVGGSMNIYFRADLTKYVAHRPSELYRIMQPGANVGGIGMGLIRAIRPWNEWLIVWGYASNATVTDGQIKPDFALDADLHNQPTT